MDSREAAGVWLIEDVDHDGVLVLLAHADDASHQALPIVDPGCGVVHGCGVQVKVIVNEHHEAVVHHGLDDPQEAVVAGVVGDQRIACA